MDIQTGIVRATARAERTWYWGEPGRAWGGRAPPYPSGVGVWSGMPRPDVSPGARADAPLAPSSAGASSALRVLDDGRVVWPEGVLQSASFPSRVTVQDPEAPDQLDAWGDRTLVLHVTTDAGRLEVTLSIRRAGLAWLTIEAPEGLRITGTPDGRAALEQALQARWEGRQYQEPETRQREAVWATGRVWCRAWSGQLALDALPAAVGAGPWAGIPLLPWPEKGPSRLGPRLEHDQAPLLNAVEASLIEPLGDLAARALNTPAGRTWQLGVHLWMEQGAAEEASRPLQPHETRAEVQADMSVLRARAVQRLRDLEPQLAEWAPLLTDPHRQVRLAATRLMGQIAAERHAETRAQARRSPGAGTGGGARGRA